MTNNEQDDKLDFKALVTRCAGSDRQEQEVYLVRIVMQVMIDYFGRDTRLPDANVLQALIAKGIVNEICEKDVYTAMKVLDTFYGMIARAFLDDVDFNPSSIRSKAMEFMLKNLRERPAAQQESNIK